MILWFSGTGNSRFVAEQLSAELGERLTELRLNVASTPIKLTDEDKVVIWVFPVYSWGVPPYIRTIIKNIKFEMSENECPIDICHHLVLTCGDDCGLAPEMWRRDIGKRGWQTGGTFSVTMPNNYVCMSGFDVDSTDVETRKLQEAPTRIKEISVKIKTFSDSTRIEKIDDVVRGRFPWIKTKIIYSWFVRHAMSPKGFHHTSDCISCGKCASVCPLRNIEMRQDAEADSSGRKRKYPHWGENCAFCLGCYHICPRHAVMYGNATRKKGQYFNPSVRTL